MNWNRVQLGGNLTRDPQSKVLPSNTTVTEFGIAANRRWKTDGGEQREEVTFVDCAAFGKVAEIIAEHFTKGKGIFIDGRLKLDQWEDKNGGGKRSKLSVVVDNFQFTDARGDGEQQPQGQAPVARRDPRAEARQRAATSVGAPYDADQFKDDDIPF